MSSLTPNIGLGVINRSIDGGMLTGTLIDIGYDATGGNFRKIDDYAGATNTALANKANADLSNVTVPFTPEWGNIQGDITAQSDLQGALSGKADKTTVSLAGNIASVMANGNFQDSGRGFGVAGGVSTLDNNAKIPMEQMPIEVVGGLHFIDTFDPNTGIDNQGNPIPAATSSNLGWFWIASFDVNTTPPPVTWTPPGNPSSLQFNVGDYIISNGTYYDFVPASVVDGVARAMAQSAQLTADAKTDYNPNLLINGNFDIWQRGLSQVTTGYGSDDRWDNVHTGGYAKTHQQMSFATPLEVPSSRFYSRTIITSYGGDSDRCYKVQRLEPVFEFLKGGQITLSFWARSIPSGRKLGMVLINTNFAVFGGAPILPSITLTDIWEKHTVTFEMPNTTGFPPSHNLAFYFGTGSNFATGIIPTDLGHQTGTFDIAQVKLEIGDKATPFVSRHIAEELELCKRYYQIINTSISGNGLGPLGAAWSETASFFTHSMPNEMRVLPTVILPSIPTTPNFGVTIDGGATVMTITSFQLINSNTSFVKIRADYAAYGSRGSAMQLIGPPTIGLDSEL